MSNKELPRRLNAITLRNDYAFKKIFGTDRNKDILTAFVSLAIGISSEDFEEVTIENPDLPQKFFEDKKGRLDIKIKLKNGTKIDVEMQNLYLNHYPKRTLYYWSELFLENFEHGDEYKNLNKAIVINILNEPFPLSNKLHSTFKVLETEEHTLFSDAFEIHFFNLSKLKEDEGMLHTMQEIERWLLFIKTSKDNIREKLARDNPVMQKANEELKHFYLTDEDRKGYLMMGQAMSDHASIMGELRDARNEGIQEGIQQGIEKGRAEGAYSKAIATAKNLLGMGLSLKDIAIATGLAEDEIMQLK